MFRQDKQDPVSLPPYLTFSNWRYIALNGGQDQINMSNMFKGCVLRPDNIYSLRGIQYDKTYKVNASEMFRSASFNEFYEDTVYFNDWFSGRDNKPILSGAAFMFSDSFIPGKLSLTN